MNLKRLALPLAMVAALIVTGCSQPTVPKDNYYRLQVAMPDAAPGTVFKGVVEVQRFIADGLTASRPIVYSKASSPQQLNAYHYHFWTEPPVVMLRDQLVDFLRAANVAELIVTPEMRSRIDYVLTAKIKRLEKVSGATPRAVVEVELGLQDSAKGEVVHLKNYRVETTAKSDSVVDAVVALNKALASAYTLFVEDLKKL
ncbi:MAG: ABC-type transport auxiliary lipoprotein family protein [Alphaproteobacteria bacterium]